ncbi:cation-translocating P-type ATPase [Vagococcus sp. BWB3-3]|uniref:Cation-translocating P-type ATPase n=1 Tax=Vagococcus allomyrinae TaxID=2794353 RepID=A0A940SUH1_9ENTE|nr:cation-translocating P-type ATPase [Vagococcus allomyrinae]MBP1044307.1 cation-translocating P-type ATPase [Vagococcus allomyrinae]
MKVKQDSIEIIARTVKVNPDNGLTTSQIVKNREQYGENIFEETTKETLFQKVCHHLVEVMNLILIGTAVFSFILALQTPDEGYVKSIVILSIVIINISVSIFQEGKADNALSALKKLSAPNSVVLRDGKKETIQSEELVVGDIIYLNVGDQIGADIRLIQANSLQIDESSLSGESIPIEKDPSLEFAKEMPLGDQLNMAFSGTNVLNGNGLGIVVAVGAESQMGQIASLLVCQKKDKTPLQKRIDRLAKRLAILAFLAGALIFIINTLTSSVPLVENLMTAVILGVAAVPETLPVIVTLSLIYGMENMARKQAIIRNIPAVETLGSASVIASDKTGTLTQNKMVVKRLWVLHEEVKTVDDKTNWSRADRQLVDYMALASNATAELNEEDQWVVHGDPTESAIIQLLGKLAGTKGELETKFKRVLELPFDSSRKKMTTVHQLDQGYLVLTKGAFDRLTDNLHNEAAFKQADAASIHDQFAKDALRVLALSYKVIDHLPTEGNEPELEVGQTFYGMIGIIDPPRLESARAVAEARKAGIKPIMITGDHLLTATAIAKELDIYRSGDLVMTGIELEKIIDSELEEKIDQISVYARVSPENKIRIVKAWQQKGQVVAMTGDGVNDAPSLKAADVGTAMGIAGTEVAKSASDIVLADDNFETIVKAISEGRRVYGNIKKTIYYLLSANVAEIIIMLLAAVVGWGMPLNGLQLLFINVLADGIPGFGLSREKAESGIMLEPPVGMDESLFSRGGYRRIVTAATTFTVTSLAAFYLGSFVDLGTIAPSLAVGQTMTFLVLSISSTVHIFVARSNKPLIKAGLRENTMIFWTAVFSLLLTVTVALVPGLAAVLGLVPLGLVHWTIVSGLSSYILVVVELEKYILQRMGRRFIA